jgi:hypothetical protein
MTRYGKKGIYLSGGVLTKQRRMPRNLWVYPVEYLVGARPGNKGQLLRQSR